MVTSSAAFHLVGVVQLVLTCSLTQINDKTYEIHEVSNSRDGYDVVLSTNQEAHYDGFLVIPGESTITHVLTQEVSIDKRKRLVFAIVPSYVKVSCRSNE